MKHMEFIPFALPSIGQEEIDEVVETLRSGWITTGSRAMRLEQDFRFYSGAADALAVNSGTAAMHMALAAMDIGPEDEVITTPLTFCATVTTILHVGATPVLADILPNGNIDPKSIASRITPRTKAIMPVHVAGLPCDMDAIWDLAREHDLRVIEDAAHAAGTFHNGTHLGGRGTRSDAVAFSFYANKNMTTGEGGMVTTNSEELAERMRVLRLHGISKDAWKRYTKTGNWFYEVLEAGFKYNLSDLQAAVGIHQLRKLEGFTATRTRYAEMYNDMLGGMEEIELPPDDARHRHAWHLYMIRLKLDKLTVDRAGFIEKLRERNVGASVHFIPIPLHRFFTRWANRKQNQCPKALELYPRLVSLPLYPGMTEEQVGYVADSVKAIVAESKKRKLMPAAAGF
ncbi:MAG: DegT/DnrJ/EryC1/StrS aminotransferase family protein [Bryobacteraceae bacterium]|nr:DegT/DnrJ/EryC1/StrS aminotransferase family protein [Bryobacteraceae bacterium]